MNKESYTAANVLPVKLLKNKDKFVENGFIKPIHVQLCPTNKCNLNCSFCSCSEREKKQELSFANIIDAIGSFKMLGMKSVTITGGGEPCCYPQLGDLIKFLYAIGIRIGLVSNGLMMDKVSNLRKLTWCRVSVSDERDINELLAVMDRLVPRKLIDWAFSYVITEKYDVNKVAEIVKFANIHKMTHVRLVHDLLNLDSLVSMEQIKQDLKCRHVDDSIVVYQGRKEYTKGYKKCSISLLKPVLAPDGYIYPCCGVQYAIDTKNVFPKEMRMCNIAEIDDYWRSQIVYYGSGCNVCYYGEYNQVLEAFNSNYDHEWFV